MDQETPDLSEIKKRRYTDDVIQARLELLRGGFPLKQDTQTPMQKIRDVLADAGTEIRKIVEENGEHDKGRLISAIDTLQIVKNVSIESMLMPMAPMAPVAPMK